MPDMKICPNSGGILFHQTPEEKQFSDMRIELQKELEATKNLRKELEQLIKQVKE